MRSVAVRALRTALPLYAGQAVAHAAAFATSAALVFWIFRDAPEAVAHFGVLTFLLQASCAVGVGALAAGLFRLHDERPADRRDLVATAWLGAIALSAVVVGAIEFVPGLAHLLLGDAVAERHVAPFLWKTPAVAAIAVTAAVMHATNSLRRRAAVVAGEGVVVALLTVVGALYDGLDGLLWGSVAGSVLVAVALGVRRGRFRGALFVDLFRAGRPQAVFLLLEAARPVLVLRLMYALGAGVADTAMLVVAMSVTLPLVVLPELLAQAVHPARIGARDGSAALERVRRRLSLEMLALTLSATVLVVAAATWLLPRVGEGRYARAVPVVLAMVPGVAAHVFVACTGHAVLVRRALPRVAFASAAALAVAGALALLLVPRWGAVGGAAALSTALAVRAALLVVAARSASKCAPTPGAPTSLDDVRRAADPKSFPTYVFDGATTVASFFSAAFHGRNDCIHVADAGVTDALLVDLDEEKLAEMAALYPPTWRCAAGDAYVVAESLRAVGATFDVVVVDGWSGEAARMLTENLPLWCALSRRWTVLMVSKPWFDAQGVAPEPAAVREWAKRRHGVDVAVEALHFRSDWVGGTWWIVVRT